MKKLTVLIFCIAALLFSADLSPDNYAYSGDVELPAKNDKIDLISNTPLGIQNVSSIRSNEIIQFYSYDLHKALLYRGTKGTGISSLLFYPYPKGFTIDSAVTHYFYHEKGLHKAQYEKVLYFGTEGIYSNKSTLWYKDGSGGWHPIIRKKSHADSKKYPLVVEGIPAEATILVNGEPLLRQKFPAGAYKVLVAFNGYNTLDTLIQLPDIKVLKYVLHERTVSLEVNAVDAVTGRLTTASVIIDGKEVGTTPLTTSVTAFTKKIELRKDGYQSVQKALDLEKEVRFSLDISLNSNPQDSGALYGMKKIPGGTFQMGSNSGNADEKPVHSVTVSGFWMDSTEVTQVEFERLMGVNPSYFKGANRPVENVNWYDAALYCNERSKEAGLDTVYSYRGLSLTPKNSNILSDVSINYSTNGYRLPTEAEWEYACRAGRVTTFYWGNSTKKSIVEQFAVYDSTSFYMNADSDNKGTHFVASYRPNRYDLYDMSGNVSEWCNDWYDENYYGSSIRNNPEGISSGLNRVRRGGSWITPSYNLRSAYRICTPPGYCANSMGFRCVRSLEDGVSINTNKKGIIFIHTLPVMADIYVDGKYIGKSNTKEIILPVGYNILSLKKDGKSADLSVEIKEGANSPKLVRLK